MAEIIPFKGVRYAAGKAGPLKRVIAPPYDVISPEEQNELYRKSPYNIIRLEKPRQEPGDLADEKYLRAGSQYRWWLKEGVLRREEKPTLYLYEEGFGGGGAAGRSGRDGLVRRGLICGVHLTPYEERVVLPHEETMSGPKEDRLKLMRAGRANFSPLFSLYEDRGDFLSFLWDASGYSPPAVDFSDSRGHRHRIWLVEDEGAQRETAGFFNDKQVFIADGHHRYETALSYYRELGQPRGSAAAYVMMSLVNIYDPGLTILPTHRLVMGSAAGGGGARPAADAGEFLSALEEDYRVEKVPCRDAGEICRRGLDALRKAGKEGPAFGLVLGEGNFFLLRARWRAGEGEGFLELDATRLQEEILEKRLGIDTEKRHTGEALRYTRDCGEAAEQVLRGEARMAFLMNPTPAETVTRTAAAGRKMPQKSTYFYPKLTAGLVINPLD